MSDHSSCDLSLSQSGSFLVSVFDSTVRILDLSGRPQTARVILPGLLTATAMDDEVWAITRAASTPESSAAELILHRLDRSGESVAEPLSIAEDEGPVKLCPSPGGKPASAVLTATEKYALRTDCGAVTVEAFRPRPDSITPLSADDWLFVVDDALGYHRDGSFVALPGAPEITRDASLISGCRLSDGRSIAVFAQGSRGESPILWIMDAKRGELRHRIVLENVEGETAPAIHTVAFAPERGQAIVAHGNHLQIIDLRFGRVLIDWKCANQILDIACDPRGRVVAVLQENDTADEIAWIDYRELLRRSSRSLAWSTADTNGPEETETENVTTEKSKPLSNGHSPVAQQQGATVANGVSNAGASITDPTSSPTTMPLTGNGRSEPGSYLLEAPTGSTVFGSTNGTRDHTNHTNHTNTCWEQDDSSAHRRPTLPVIPSNLAALCPRTLPDSASGDSALAILQHHLALVGAWTKLAIARAWDSGRVAFSGNDTLPFGSEVHALLDGAGGLAEREVNEARLQVVAIEQLHDQELESHRNCKLSSQSQETISPLAALAREFELSQTATDLLLVVAAPAIWGSMARLYAIVANDKGRRMCDEWLLVELLKERASRIEIARELEESAPLLRHGLLTSSGISRPFAGLSVDPIVIQRLYGENFSTDNGDSWIRASEPCLAYQELTLSADLNGFLDSLRQDPDHPARLVVRGRLGSGRRSLLAALAAKSGRRLGMIDLVSLRHRSEDLSVSLAEALRRAELRGWLPCIVGLEHVGNGNDEAHANHSIATIVANFSGPIAFRCESGNSPPIKPGYALVDLSPLTESERVGAWRRALKRRSLSTQPARRLASKYLMGPGIMERVSAQVPRLMGASDDVVELTDLLEAAIRQHRENRLTKLATRVTRLASWSNVVLPDEIIDSVREFIGRIRHRRTVFERWGFDKVMSSSRGLTALFAGRPGTGKTMVAGLIARELGYDLYRVDLSRIMSKWIGETEKHLADLFDAAEGGQVILLFDEADSLFAKRTEVKSSNDRFANLGVNYLLQRLDSFEGVAILTTNFGKSIDPAFKRRLSIRLSFPFPDEDLREEIWRAHLPRELPRSGTLDLEALAQRYQLSGGYIRNIVLRAAFLAAHESRPLAQKHLERAIALEYQAMGNLTTGGILE